jgi:dihydrodipicolinate synthase/N-acetylneuraminate lyase
MRKNGLMGAVFSVPMFFKKNKSVDYEALKAYLIKCLETDGIDTIFSMAYNTRYRQLNNEELFEVNKLCCQLATKYDKKAIIGHAYTITNSELEAYCEAIKEYNPYAISLLYPERYYGIDTALIDFFSIPKKSNIPVLIHEQKLISGFDGSLIDWSNKLLNLVFQDPNVIAVKEDSKNDDVTREVMKLSKKFDFDVIVAGGGKKRVRKLIKEIDLKCWLNGSLMLFPEISGKVISAYLNQDELFTNKYEEKVETPYFDKVISKLGWHVGHKAALFFLGYCELEERNPLPICPKEELKYFEEIVLEIRDNVRKLKI